MAITIGLFHTSYSLLEGKVGKLFYFVVASCFRGEIDLYLFGTFLTFDNISIDDVLSASFAENTGQKTIKREVAFSVLCVLFFYD